MRTILYPGTPTRTSASTPSTAHPNSSPPETRSTRKKHTTFKKRTDLDVDEMAGPFAMTPTRVKAAILCADGSTSMESIAAEAGISVVVLYRWRHRAEFKAVVQQRRDQLANEFMQSGLAEKWRRVRILQNQVEKMLALQEARAEAMQKDDPGGETGLLAPMINARGSPYTVTDTALTKEIRETLKMLSQELGQWATKVDVTSGGQPIRFTIPMNDETPTVIEGEVTAGGLAGATDVNTWREFDSD